MGPRIEYTVHRIAGDYAFLRDAAGDEIQIAMALLPEAIDEGKQMLFENYTYTLLD